MIAPLLRARHVLSSCTQIAAYERGGCSLGRARLSRAWVQTAPALRLDGVSPYQPTRSFVKVHDSLQLKLMRLLLPFCLLLAFSLPASAGSNTVVNLSHYDLMRVDFSAMRAQGIVGVIHESSYPPGTQDEKYFVRQEAAVRAGLLWGAYHYANASDPARQADFFLDTVERAWKRADHRPEEVLLVLDFEKNGHYPGGTMRVDQAAQFIERVHQRTGKYPGLYSGENRLRAVLGSSAVTPAVRGTLERCWLWVANYHYQPGALGPWSEWMLWQYTGDGVCDLPRASYPKNIANVRNAERNIFRGSPEQAREFWKRHGWAPGGRAD